MCDAEQFTIMGIALIKGLQVRLLIGHSFHPEDDAKSFAGDGDIGQQPVRVILQQLHEPHGLGFGQVVKVHHRVLRNGSDAVVTSVLLEYGGRGEGRTFLDLDFIGILFETLRCEIAELFSVFLQGDIGSNQTDHFPQRDECRRVLGLQCLKKRKLRFLLHCIKVLNTFCLNVMGQS